MIAIGVSAPPGPQPADFTSDPVIDRLAEKTGRSNDYLLEHLEADQPPAGVPYPPINLIAEADSEEQAKRLLAAWMATIREVRHERVATALDSSEEVLEEALRKAVAQRPGEESVKVKSIISLLTRLDSLRASFQVDYSIFRQAAPAPAEGVSRLRGAVLGAGGGLVVGIALALLIALFDGRIRTREGYEVALGVAPLADLSEEGGLPSLDHAREKLRDEDGSLPASVLLVPLGQVDAAGAAGQLASALGGAEVRVTEPLGRPGLLEELASAPRWAVVAAPTAADRGEASAFRGELSGIGTEPAGLVYVADKARA
jgi:hypothetical protein